MTRTLILAGLLLLLTSILLLILGIRSPELFLSSFSEESPATQQRIIENIIKIPFLMALLCFAAALVLYCIPHEARRRRELLVVVLVNLAAVLAIGTPYMAWDSLHAMTEPKLEEYVNDVLGHGDADSYLELSVTLNTTPPFKYRVLTPFLARGAFFLARDVLTDSGFLRFPDDIVTGYAIVNLLFVFFTGLMFYYYLLTFGIEPVWALLGCLLFHCSSAVIQTAFVPMVDAGAYFFMLAGMFAIKQDKLKWLIPVLILSPLQKEALAVLGIMYFTEKMSQPDRGRKLLTALLISALPFVSFIGIRLLWGDAPLTVNYGLDAAHGEMPGYIFYRLTPVGYIGECVGILGTFTALWIGIIGLRHNPFLKRMGLVAIPLLLLAQLLLSSRIVRVLFVLFPVIIPGFLLWGRRQLKCEK